MKNIHYQTPQPLSPWRKVSLGSWKPTGDSSVYSLEEIEVESALAYCEKNDITFYEFCIKAISAAIEKYPKINATVRFGRIYPRKDVSVFFHTIKGREHDDLSGVRIINAQQKNWSEIHREFSEGVMAVKESTSLYEKSKQITGRTPLWLVKPLMDLYSFVAYSLNRNSRAFGMPKDAFGSVMVTAIGSLNLTAALCPIAPYTKVPLILSIGKVEERPIVKDGKVLISNMISFGFTFDHRLIDGMHFADLFLAFKSFITKPSELS